MDRIRINHSQDLTGLDREFSKVATFFKAHGGKSLTARFSNYIAVKFLSASWWYVREDGNAGDFIQNQKFSDIMKNFYE